jgi:hypothetical protein
MGPADPYGSEGIATLVEAFQKGDREERSRIGEQIALRFEPVVRRAWRELIRGRSSVEYEDFAQDVFVRVFSSLGQLRTPAAFPGYFRSIARNVAVDSLRRQGARPEFADVDPDIVGARLDHRTLNTWKAWIRRRSWSEPGCPGAVSAPPRRGPSSDYRRSAVRKPKLFRRRWPKKRPREGRPRC